MNPIKIYRLIKPWVVMSALLCPYIAYGKQLTASEALTRALDFSTGLKTRGNIISDPVLTVTSPRDDSFKSLFVFNLDDGFIIISADDSSAPILGYSLTNRFETDNIPPQLRWWLDEYSLQIQKNADCKVSYFKVETRDTQEKIEPLITSKWDQAAPYWNKCPLIQKRNTYTGCAATAVAQVMNYYKWPVNPSGEKISYNDYNQLIEWDPNGVTFQWDKMLDVYKKNNYSDEEADAVAELMFGVGAAINTYYDRTGSGAYEAIYGPALFKYFDYSPDMKLIEREYYTQQDWESIIIDQLTKKQPVVYTGYDESYYYGHAFVCDGYDGEGYFHINWGWSGDCDGYYLLDALYPADGGIGAGSEDYNFYQHALIDILPSYASSEFHPLILGNGNFKASGIEKASDTKSVKLGSAHRFFTGSIYDEGIRNNSSMPVKGYIGIRLINQTTGETTELYPSSDVLLDVTYDDYMSPVKKNVSIVLSEDLSDGSYNIYPIFKPNDSEETIDILYPLDANKILNMKVSGKDAVVGYGASDGSTAVSMLGDDSDIYYDIYDFRGIRIRSNVDITNNLDLPSGYYIIRNKKIAYKIKI